MTTHEDRMIQTQLTKFRALEDRIAQLEKRLDLMSKSHDNNAEVLAETSLHLKVNEFITARMLGDQAKGELKLGDDGTPNLVYYLEMFESFRQSKIKEEVEAELAEQAERAAANPPVADMVFGGDYGSKV